MKKGITVSILVITVIIMFTLVTTATVVGTKSIQTAAYEEFISKINRVSDDINEYVIKNKELPVTSEIVAKEGLANELKAEIKRNKDDYNNLYVVDMKKIKTSTNKLGTGTISDMNVFLVAEKTNNIYYFKGVKYKGNIYYGIQYDIIALKGYEALKDENGFATESTTYNGVKKAYNNPIIPRGFNQYLIQKIIL